jgi:hypothetical protein
MSYIRVSLNTVNSNVSVQLQVGTKKINWNHNIVIAIENTVISAHRYFPRTDYLPPWLPTKSLELISMLISFDSVNCIDQPASSMFHPLLEKECLQLKKTVQDGNKCVGFEGSWWQIQVKFNNIRLVRGYNYAVKSFCCITVTCSFLPCIV